MSEVSVMYGEVAWRRELVVVGEVDSVRREVLRVCLERCWVRRDLESSWWMLWMGRDSEEINEDEDDVDDVCVLVLLNGKCGYFIITRMLSTFVFVLCVLSCNCCVDVFVFL